MSIPSSSRYKQEIILPSVSNNMKPKTAISTANPMKPANQRSRFFDHQLIGPNRMPQHLYNKKVVKLAIDRFGPSIQDQKKGRNVLANNGGAHSFRGQSNNVENNASFDLSGQYQTHSSQYLNASLNIPNTTRGPRAAVLNMSLGGPLRLTQNPFEELDVTKRSQKKTPNKGITVLGRLKRQVGDHVLDQSVHLPMNTDSSIAEGDNDGMNQVFIEDLDQKQSLFPNKLRPNIRMLPTDRKMRLTNKIEKSTASLFDSARNTQNSNERMIINTGRSEKKPNMSIGTVKTPAVKMGLRLQDRHIRKSQIPVITETSFHNEHDDLRDRNDNRSFNDGDEMSSDSDCKSLEVYELIGDDLKKLTQKSRGAILPQTPQSLEKQQIRVAKKKSRRNNLVDLLEKGKRYSRVQTADKMKLSLKKARRKQEMQTTEIYRNQFAEKFAKDQRINRKQIEKMKQADEDLVNEPQEIDLYIKNPKKYKLEMRDQIKIRYLKGLEKKENSDSDNSSSESSGLGDNTSVSVSIQSSIGLDELQDEKAFEAYLPPKKLLDMKRQSSISSVRKQEKSRDSSIEDEINQDNMRLIKLYRAEDISQKIQSEVNFSNQDKIDQQVEHRKNKLKKRQFESSGGKVYKIKVNKAFQDTLPPTPLAYPEAAHGQRGSNKTKKIAANNRRFVTGPNGKQVIKAQIDDGFSQLKERSRSGGYKTSDKSNESVIIEEMELSDFTEFEDQPLSKEETFYAGAMKNQQKKRMVNNRGLSVNKSPIKVQQTLIGKTKIEESNRIKNVKIWNEFEQKQQFYKLAKENRKIYEDDGEAKFLENCLKMKVTPLPAFCRSDNDRVKKTLAPTILRNDPDGDSRDMNSTKQSGFNMKIKESSMSLMSYQISPSQNIRNQRRQGINVENQTNRIGTNQQTLKLLNYYLSEKLAKATGEKLGDVEFLFKPPEQGIQRGSQMNFQGQDVMEQMVPNEFSNLKTKVLMLDDNGLLDRGLSYILDGLAKQKQLESLNIGNNEIGPLSSAKLQQIFEGQNSKRHLVELRLTKIKFTNKNTFVKIVDSYLDSPFMGLLALKLNEINLSDSLLLSAILHMISQNKLIVDLNLQGSGLLPNQLEQVAYTVSTELKGIKYLNLAYNTMQYKPKEKHQESNENFAYYLCDIIKNSELVHLNLTGMNLSSEHLKEIVVAISQSRHLLAAHLSNNENIESEDRNIQYSLKLELFSILGINGYKWQMYNHLKRMRSIKAMQMTKGSGPNKEWIFKDLEPQEESVINHFTYQEEVQRSRQVNQFMNFCEQKELVLSNFVIQRQKNHPELDFESALKNQIGADDLIKSDRWQILELEADRGDSKHATSQLPQNRCYLCEKSPNTLFFYSRAYRDEAFTRISDPRQKKKIIQTFFSTEASSNLFQMQNNDVLMTGSLVQWDTIKLKTVEKYGMQIDGTYYEQKADERKEAKRIRKKYFKGFEPTTDELGEGKKPLGPFQKLSEVNKAQIQNMRNCKVIKYDKIVDDFDRNVPWQDQLKLHLKNQEDMAFINTPNFKRRGPVRSFVDVEQQLMSQIYIYGDYGLKPGKYSVICYDLVDQTMWFKNVVVGLRQTHVIGHQSLAQEPRLKKCRLLFPKEKYFSDNSFNFHQLPSKLEIAIANSLQQQFEEEDPQSWHKEALQVFREYYGMFVYIFTSFSKISSYPCVNLQDFGYIMRSLKLRFSWSKLIEIFQEYQSDDIVKIDRDNIHNFNFKDQSQLFEVLIKVFWHRENDESPLKYLQDKISSTIQANVSEHIWDHLYNRHLWDSSQRQVMNLVFMNIDSLQAVYKTLWEQARDYYDNDITEAFTKIMIKVAPHLRFKKRQCVGILKESKKYTEITKPEFYGLLKQSKLKIDQNLAKGIHNWNFDSYVPPVIIEEEEDDDETEQKQKLSGGNMIQVSFIEFLNFFIQMADMLPTEANYGVTGEKTPRIGEMLNSSLDKVHRFLTFFIKVEMIQVPKVPGYKHDEQENFQIKENPVRKIVTKDSKVNLQISTLKTSMRALMVQKRQTQIQEEKMQPNTPRLRNELSRLAPRQPGDQTTPNRDSRVHDTRKESYDPAVYALPSQLVFSESDLSEDLTTNNALSPRHSPFASRKNSLDLLSEEEDDGAGTMDYNKIMTALVNHNHNYSPLNNYVYTDQTSDSSYD